MGTSDQPTQPDSGHDTGPITFPTTHWSEILNAKADDVEVVQRALDALCQRYYGAIVGYFRLKLRDANESVNAEDLAHDYLAHLLEKNRLQNLDRQKVPRFRFYLSATLKNFYLDWKESLAAQKRGQGKAPIPILQPGLPEGVDVPGHAAALDPDVDRALALATHALAFGQLRRETPDPGRFERLGRYVAIVPDDGDYEQVAGELNLSEGNIRQIVRRLRLRYLALFRHEVEALVAQKPEEISHEMTYLLGQVVLAIEEGHRLN